MIDLEPMESASYIASQRPTLSSVLGAELPSHLDDWNLWEWFWQQVVCHTTDRCWEWTAGLNHEGYGRLTVERASLAAHRVSYEWLAGAIPRTFVIDHLCRNRACVNPFHLETVTNEENVRRGNGALAQNRRKTHCPRGHPYDEANTILLRKGYRRCRACQNGYYAANQPRIRERQRQYYQQRVGRDVLPPTRGRTECKWGHPFDEANTRYTQMGVRQCRACGKRRDRERYANDPVRKEGVKARAAASKQAHKQHPES